VLTIHFAVQDLARSRMVAGLGPRVEAAFALHLLAQRHNVGLRRWRAQVLDEIGVRLEEVTALTRRHRRAADLAHLALRDRAPGQCQERVHDLKVLDAVQRAVVAQDWPAIQARLDEVCDIRGRTLITNGLGRLLTVLHPRLYWDPPVLQVRQGSDREVYLGGDGLLLSPSRFLHHRHCVLVEDVGSKGEPALVFSVEATMRAELPASDEEQLGDLMGHTRAAALHILTETCSTGQLAERLGISLAGASKHVGVLRNAGLITTSRLRNRALHRLTPLGAAMLADHEPAPRTGPETD